MKDGFGSWSNSSAHRTVFRGLLLFGVWTFFLASSMITASGENTKNTKDAENAESVKTAVDASSEADSSKMPLAAIIVSDDHYHADTLFPELAPWLAENYGIRTVIIHGHGGGDFENMEALKDADVALLFIRRIAPRSEQLAIFRDYLESGRPLIAFRTSSHAFSLSFDGKKRPEPGFAEWKEFDALVLGGNYHNHGPNDAGTDVRTMPVAKDHPIFNGVNTEPYHSAGSLYFTLPIDENAILFQIGTVNGRSEPLTWLRKNPWGGLVLYTGLGHWEDFEDLRFRKMIGNAILYLNESNKKQKK